MCPISVEWARKLTLGSLQDVVCDGHGRGLRARLRPGALVLGDERKEGAPPAVDAAHCPRAGEDDPAAEEEEDDDVDVRRPVDQGQRKMYHQLTRWCFLWGRPGRWCGAPGW